MINPKEMTLVFPDHVVLSALWYSDGSGAGEAGVDSLIAPERYEIKGVWHDKDERTITITVALRSEGE